MYIRIPFSITETKGVTKSVVVGERKGKGKGKRERGREEKTGDGFVITESFSYLCMRDRYLETDKQDKHCPPCT